MAILDNQRHELFAQHLVQGMSATEAYRTAGYDAKGNSAEVNASKLLRNAKVQARVAELQSRAAQGVVINRQRVLEEMATIAFAPLGAEHIKTADKRNALNDIARLEGWVVDRSEVGKPGDFSNMTDDELDEHLEKGAREILAKVEARKARAAAAAAEGAARPGAKPAGSRRSLN